MNKLRILFSIIILLSGCHQLKMPVAEDFNTQAENKTQHEASNDALLSVNSVDDARIKARNALKENKINEAQVYYVKAYGMEPENISLLQEMAQVYKKIKKNELVELCYQLILEQKPKHEYTIMQYGLLLIKLKKYSLAQEKLMQVLLSTKGVINWQVLNGLGLINDLQGNYGQAILYFSQALEINPKQIEVLNNMAFSLYRSMRYEEANNYYKQALLINPKHEKVTFNYALLHARTKKYNTAVTLFNRLLSPEEANNNVGYIAMKNGDYEQAKHYFLQATKLSTRYYKKGYENLQMLKTLSNNQTSIYH